MNRYADDTRDMRLDPDSFAQGYFKNAVYRHWDPYEDIPQELLEQDRERLSERDQTEPEFDAFRRTIALFGAGEEAVTEDLAPLMMALDDINKQMFISSQIYEEAKHTQFFDRYWRDVINPAAEANGFEVTRPTDDRYFNDAYVELFDRTDEAMERLLTDDTPENRVEAYCHYHLAVESVLAQTGYYGIQGSWSPSGPDMEPVGEPVHLEGLVEGITRIRSDEGRHVGFGMQEVQGHVGRGEVDGAVVRDTLEELLPLIAGIVDYDTGDIGVEEETDSTPLIEYASEKLERRIEIITEYDAEIPPVEELVQIEGGRDVSAD
jgi:ribonucleoside-diphosphate reductase beta chain